MQEQKRENAKQRILIDELASWKKQEEKKAEMAWNKETLKSGGPTKPKKKKKTSIKKQLEERVEVDDLKTLTTTKMKNTSKKKQLEQTVEVDDLEVDDLETPTTTKKKNTSKKKQLEQTVLKT